MDKKEEIKYTKKVVKVQKELMGCLDKNCKVVAKNYKTILLKTKKEFKELLKNYDRNRIKEKELLSSMINLLKRNMKDLKYTNYIKCLIKNCYNNYKNYVDVAYLSLNNKMVQSYILMKAREYDVEKEVRNFLNSIKDQSTVKKIKLTANIVIHILEKIYKNNEDTIIKMIKENKANIRMLIDKM